MPLNRTVVRRLRRALLVFGLLFGVLLFAGWWVWFRLERHEHCITAAYFIMMKYPEEHEGKFPQSDKGWGDAILLFGGDSPEKDWVKYLVGVDDDGSRLMRAMETGGDVIEGECSRIYVQGLTERSSHNIAILFDRDSVKGGDHFHGMPGQKMLREVLMIDGSHKGIPDSAWPEFVANQRILLRGEGFSEAEISQYYGKDGE